MGQQFLKELFLDLKQYARKVIFGLKSLKFQINGMILKVTKKILIKEPEKLKNFKNSSDFFRNFFPIIFQRLWTWWK